MANTFSITISAVDKATATVRRVNDSISRLTRPFQDVGKSFKSLGRELGFEKIGRNLGTIGREASGAARSIGSIVAPMAAITGLGSVAGIATLAKSWANLGRSIDSSSQTIGISSGQLQSLQGAAQMVGIEASATSSSLEGLASTMQDAQWGRNQGALLMFNKLGIGLKKTKAGSWDVVAQYKAVANAIAKEASPQKQRLIAQAFGLENMLPLLSEGAAGIERYEAMVKRLGYVMGDDAVKRGKAFSRTLAGFGISIDGVKNAIGDALIPAMKPLIDQFSVWLAVNRDLIATDIGNWAKGFASWVNKIDWKKIGDGIVKFGKGIADVVGWLGGWENAAILVVGVMNAGLIASVLSLGATLVTAGAGILTYIGLLTRMGTAATIAGGAAASASAGIAGAGAGAAAVGAGLLKRGAAATGVIGATLALSGDQSDSSRAASDLQNAALGGDRSAALELSRRQLSHWFLPSPTQESIEQRADEISSGRQAGYTPAQMQALHPDQASANKLFRKLELQNGLPANLLDSVWSVESSRGQRMTSSAGAKGHFQFMDPTAAQYGLKNPSNLAESADAAARMLSDLLKANNGDLDKALAGYNWGSGNLARKGLAGAPQETQDYIRKVKSGMLNPALIPAAPDSAEPSAPQAQDINPSANSSAAPVGPYSNGVQNQGGKVQVNIEHANAPEGMKVNAKAEGNVEVSSRVSYSGVGAIA